MEIYHRLRALFSKQTSRNPNLIQQGSLFPAKTSPGSISPPDGAITALIFQRIIEDNFRIADLGSGPCGAFWWSQLPKGCSINAFDLYNEPQNTFDYVSFSKKDVTKLHEARKLKGKFHLVVADHIFEHVKAPSGLASSIFHILQPNGYLHVGIPDASNFTDRFYRLIHPDGGGHIQQFTRDSFLKFITAYGFELIEEKPWPDDWRWFEKLYSLDYYKVQHLTKEEKVWIANVFRKELTPEKGYSYGWEFLFSKEGR